MTYPFCNLCQKPIDLGHICEKCEKQLRGEVKLPIFAPQLREKNENERKKAA